ncbi:MAG: HEPN domain-containing protein [Blastocatellia bacterium]
MKALTTEWIEKAEEDWVMMLKGYRARKDPAYNASCFHAQQCAEKYLKGGLEEAGIPFRKTHDLKELLTQSLAVEPTWNSLDPELDNLNRFSILFRYPGRSAVKSDAKKAVEDCRKVRRVIRTSLGLPV